MSYLQRRGSLGALDLSKAGIACASSSGGFSLACLQISADAVVAGVPGMSAFQSVTMPTKGFGLMYSTLMDMQQKIANALGDYAAKHAIGSQLLTSDAGSTEDAALALTAAKHAIDVDVAAYMKARQAKAAYVVLPAGFVFRVGLFVTNIKKAGEIADWFVHDGVFASDFFTFWANGFAAIYAVETTIVRVGGEALDAALAALKLAEDLLKAIPPAINALPLVLGAAALFVGYKLFFEKRGRR